MKLHKLPKKSTAKITQTMEFDARIAVVRAEWYPVRKDSGALSEQQHKLFELARRLKDENERYEKYRRTIIKIVLNK